MQRPREIKNRIRAIDDIARITGALEIVALTRLKRKQDLCLGSRPYFEKIRHLLNEVTESINFYNHPVFLTPFQEKEVGFIVIGSDKGLCGNFNYNILNAWRRKKQDINPSGYRLAIFGRRIARMLKRENPQVIFQENVSQEEGLTQKVFGLSQDLMSIFLNKKIDSLYLIYNHFHQHLIGTANVIKLLPLGLSQRAKKGLVRDYIYQPGQEEIFESLVKEYLFIQIFHALSESRVSEEMARMVAMKQATDNAKELLDKLNLDYHKSRQMNITRELLDIVAATRQ